eukprot:GHVU01205856.1.p1 GENE.GHVU01205856.1~~GHVU01205856.1.p1  ORF type:complete len:280 (-),score=78.91 GHVU01205856.1:300-1016(-)
MASTLGSLEALLQFLKDEKVPVYKVDIGTVRESDVKSAAIMREKGRPEYAVIMAFDVKTDPEATRRAEALQVRILSAEIIYHLFDFFKAFRKEMAEEKKRLRAKEAVWPCRLQIIPEYIFNKKDPLVFGVKVVEGAVKVGTPLVCPKKGHLLVGAVQSIEYKKASVDKGTEGQEVCLKVQGDANITFGRQIDENEVLESRVSFDSYECLREVFADELSDKEKKLAKSLVNSQYMSQLS